MLLPEGWFTDEDIEAYRKLVSEVPEYGSICELGTWKGRSLCSIADLIKQKNLIVTAVDTFEGSENEGDAHIEAKQIDLEKLFKFNLEEFDIRHIVNVFRGNTTEVVKKLADHQFDLIFLDADHSEEAVFRDITDWFSKLKEGGIFSGHDWVWESVRKALDRTGKKYIQINNANVWKILN